MPRKNYQMEGPPQRPRETKDIKHARLLVEWNSNCCCKTM